MSDTSIRFSEATTQNIAMESTNIELRETKDSNKMHQSQHNDSDVNTTAQGALTVNHTGLNRRSRHDRNNVSSSTILIQSPPKAQVAKN